jgi:hypothetical protein
MAVDYGVPTDAYVAGLEQELANIVGNSDADKAHRDAVTAELASAKKNK